MDNNRTKVILQDLRTNLEDIIVKLNSHSPQSLHDDLIPLIEDIEMLQSGLDGPSLNDKPKIPEVHAGRPIIIGSTIMEIEKLLGPAGMNGGTSNTEPEEEPTLEEGMSDLLESITRLDERIQIEARCLPINPPPNIERVENILGMKELIQHIKDIAVWLDFVIDEAEVILEEEEEKDDDESQDKFDV